MSRPNPKEISPNTLRMLTSAYGYNFRSVVEEARDEADWSTLKNFKTGAVLFSLTKDDVDIISAHSVRTADGSIHAEEYALIKLDTLRNSKEDFGLNYDSCFIFTLNKGRNIANNSKPCAHCVSELFAYGIKYVFYPIIEDGVVKIVNASVNDLHDSSKHIPKSKYAKLMRF